MPLIQNANRLPLPQIREVQVPELPIGSDADDNLYRPMGGRTSDLPPYDQKQQVKIGRFNYLLKPVAHRMTEIMRDYVMGGDVGFRISAEDKAVQDLIDEHWDDPFNDWPRRLPEYVLALSIDGELALPASVDGGRVVIGQIDPLAIRKVEPEPFHIGTPKTLILTSKDVAGQDVRMDVIGLDRRKRAKTYGKRVGETFFWTINRVPGATRGVSDLFMLNDLIDMLDRFLYARARNAELRNMFIWDITLAGAGETQVQQYRDNLMRDPPIAGSARVHSDTVAWSTVRADVDASQAHEEAQMIFSYILFGFGIPPTATGALTADRMSLAEQIDILHKTFSSRSREISGMVGDVVDFIIDQAIIAGLLKEGVNREYKIITPRVALRDVQRMGGALARVSDFFVNVAALGLYSREEMRQMLDPYLVGIGFDVPEFTGTLPDPMPIAPAHPQPDEPQPNEPSSGKQSTNGRNGSASATGRQPVKKAA